MDSDAVLAQLLLMGFVRNQTHRPSWRVKYQAREHNIVVYGGGRAYGRPKNYVAYFYHSSRSNVMTDDPTAVLSIVSEEIYP